MIEIIIELFNNNIDNKSIYFIIILSIENEIEILIIISHFSLLYEWFESEMKDVILNNILLSWWLFYLIFTEDDIYYRRWNQWIQRNINKMM